jgi:hypothetical protein
MPSVMNNIKRCIVEYTIFIPTDSPEMPVRGGQALGDNMLPGLRKQEQKGNAQSRHDCGIPFPYQMQTTRCEAGDRDKKDHGPDRVCQGKWNQAGQYGKNTAQIGHQYTVKNDQISDGGQPFAQGFDLFLKKGGEVGFRAFGIL